MKSISLKVVDWWVEDNDENFYNNFLVQRLMKRYNVIYSQKPDYLIYGPFGNKHMQYKKCVKIFFTQENIKTNWYYADYGVDYDNSTIENVHKHMKQARYLSENYQRLVLKNKEVSNNFKRTKFCSFLVSAQAVHSPRDVFFKKLCNYKKVDSGGGI